jgi:hypothetical protein
MTLNDLLSLIVASCALIISFITFYLSKLRKAKIEIVLNDSINVCYNYDGHEFFELHLPFAIINNGANSGIVYKCAISISTVQDSSHHYFMVWDKFLKFDPSEYRYAYEDIVHPIILTSNSSMHKLISFVWDDPKNKFTFKPGQYELYFYFWLSPEKKSKPDKGIRSTFDIDEEIINDMKKSLNAAKKNDFNPYTSISLNGTPNSNNILTLTERNKLL